MSRCFVTLFCVSCFLVFTSCTPYATVKEAKVLFHPYQFATGSLSHAQQYIAKAMASDVHKPALALGNLLAATKTAGQALTCQPKDPTALAAYNFALARIFSRLHDAKIGGWEKPIIIPSSEGDWELVGTGALAPGPNRSEIEFIPADRIAIGGSYAKERSCKSGLGAPLIAVIAATNSNQKSDPFAQGQTRYYGVTAVARFEGRRCVIRFEDPLATESTSLAGNRYPLAADFTAPLAVMLARENPKKMELSRLLRPAKFAETARLARLQPYDPSKIPIICVHGLMDSPATWAPLINHLRADPAIRARYQFWFYSYPSGYPYPHSAAIFRRQLDAIKKQYPGHKDAILIGHSMGGCISRLMITDSGDQIWRDIFGKSPAATDLPAETHRHFSETLIFKKREDVARVIFISAPLRGSDIASNWPARFGSYLVKSPVSLLKAGQDAMSFVTQTSDSLKLKRMPNSIDTMSPKNRFVQAINKIEPSTTIPYHVIIGDRGKGGNLDHSKPMKSDGFVPYWSSHMPGAQSELTVPSNHSAHQNPEAMEEVKRILHRHVERPAKITSKEK